MLEFVITLIPNSVKANFIKNLNHCNEFPSDFSGVALGMKIAMPFDVCRQFGVTGFSDLCKTSQPFVSQQLVMMLLSECELIAGRRRRKLFFA